MRESVFVYFAEEDEENEPSSSQKTPKNIIS